MTILVGAMALTVLTIAGCADSGGGQESRSESSQPPSTAPPPQAQKEVGPDGRPVKTLEDFPNDQDGAEVEAVITTDKGQIVLRFFPDVAPVTVASFLNRARSGFYDGTTFHRVEPDFVIQGGDPKSRDPNATDVGTGGPGYYLPAEFNERPHETGTLSMARSQSPNSGGSQFFICLAPQPTLDDEYTVFGETVSGMEVVQSITPGDVIRRIEIRPRTG